MLADPRHSCIVLLNVTRRIRVDAQTSALGRCGNPSLLPACREVFGIAPNVEIVCANFEEMPRNKDQLSADPAAELRTIWSKKGVSVERQDGMIAEIEAKARGGIRFDERPVQADLFTDLGPYAPKR